MKTFILIVVALFLSACNKSSDSAPAPTQAEAAVANKTENDIVGLWYKSNVHPLDANRNLYYSYSFRKDGIFEMFNLETSGSRASFTIAGDKKRGKYSVSNDEITLYFDDDICQIESEVLKFKISSDNKWVDIHNKSKNISTNSLLRVELLPEAFRGNVYVKKDPCSF